MLGFYACSLVCSYAYAVNLCFDLDLIGVGDDNAILYARRISADSVDALTRGDGHICSALCYVQSRPERTSRRRG